MKKKIKIASILPYKENYTKEKASAASLWVAEFYKKSKLKKNNYIFGNTSSKNYLTRNYINITLKNIKSKFKSSTKEYTEKLIGKPIPLLTDSPQVVEPRDVENPGIEKTGKTSKETETDLANSCDNAEASSKLPVIKGKVKRVGIKKIDVNRNQDDELPSPPDCVGNTLKDTGHIPAFLTR